MPRQTTRFTTEIFCCGGYKVLIAGQWGTQPAKCADLFPQVSYWITGVVFMLFDKTACFSLFSAIPKPS
jgi:hypothetical protein